MVSTELTPQARAFITRLCLQSCCSVYGQWTVGQNVVLLVRKSSDEWLVFNNRAHNPWQPGVFQHFWQAHEAADALVAGWTLTPLEIKARRQNRKAYEAACQAYDRQVDTRNPHKVLARLFSTLNAGPVSMLEAA